MNKIKIGVIGAGWWATENHIPHLAERDEVELTSVCKLEEDQLSFVKNKFNFKHASTDFKEMLDLSYLDGVVILHRIMHIMRMQKQRLKKIVM